MFVLFEEMKGLMAVPLTDSQQVRYSVLRKCPLTELSPYGVRSILGWIGKRAFHFGHNCTLASLARIILLYFHAEGPDSLRDLPTAPQTMSAS